MKKLYTAMLPILLVLPLLAPAPGVVADEPGQPVAANEVLESFDIPKDSDGIFVPVTVAGKQRLFLVDTGASQGAFDIRLLAGSTQETKKLLTADGAVEGKLYNPPPASVGSIPLRKDQLVAGMDFSEIREVFGMDLQGVLGMDFLQHYVWHINFDEGKLLILNSSRGKRANGFPMGKDRFGNPTLTVQIADWGNEVFIIDTGALGGTAELKSSFFEFLKVLGRFTVLQDSLHISASGKQMGRYGIGPSLTVGDFRILHCIFDETRSDNAIGWRFLSRFVVTFDFPNQTLYLEKGKAFELSDKVDVSGLHLIRREGKTLVFSTDIASAGEKLGIRPGDIISTVGTAPAAEKSLDEIRRLFCEAGQTIPLIIQRGDQTLHVSLELKRE